MRCVNRLSAWQGSTAGPRHTAHAFPSSDTWFIFKERSCLMCLPHWQGRWLTVPPSLIQWFRRNASQGKPGIYYPPKARISGAGLTNNTPCLQIMWSFDVWINNRDSLPTMQSLPMTWSFFLHFLVGCFHLHKGCQNCSQVSICLLEEGKSNRFWDAEIGSEPKILSAEN